ncbi:MAG: nucleotidyltransferase domain-containing protein [Deltaproteobacteria bacterium]|nr:nucleotidyltransferase domain-containing protein [Deltaproteobacteria bacterium]
MFKLLIKSAVRRKIVVLFALNPEVHLYARQVARELDESPHAVGLELKALVVGGLLTARGALRRLTYVWNPAYPYATLLQQAAERWRATGQAEAARIPDLAQRSRMDANLARLVPAIVERYRPEKIILFGSAVSGVVGPYSDLDLAIVKQTALPFSKRAPMLAGLVDYDIDVDFFIYTPREFAVGARNTPFIRDEILKKGRVVYEAT